MTKELDANALLAQYQADPTTDIRAGFIALVAEVNELRAERERLRLHIAINDVDIERFTHWKERAEKAERDLAAAQEGAEELLDRLSAAYDRLHETELQRDRLRLHIEQDNAQRGHVVNLDTLMQTQTRAEKAEETLGEIADALGVTDAGENLVAIVEELVDWLPEYTLDDGTNDEANVRERAEYAAGEIAQLHRFAEQNARYSLALTCISGAIRCRGDEYLVKMADASTNELAEEQEQRIRKAALREAAEICRRGTWTGKEGTAWRLDCAEEIDELADEPPKAKT